MTLGYRKHRPVNDLLVIWNGRRATPRLLKSFRIGNPFLFAEVSLLDSSHFSLFLKPTQVHRQKGSLTHFTTSVFRKFPLPRPFNATEFSSQCKRVSLGSSLDSLVPDVDGKSMSMSVASGEPDHHTK